MMRRATVIGLFAVVALRGLSACVDGVTPDCSNASVCAPSEGPLGSADAATTTDAATTDASKSETSTAADASDSG